MRRTFALAALPWLLLAIAAADASARSCVMTGPLCSRWQEYDAIFDGTATAIRRVDLQEQIGACTRTYPNRLVTFRVHDRWRGAETSEAEMLLSGGFGTWTSNSFDVQEGERYLIFARHWNGHLTTSSCDPSGKYEQAKETLAFLQSLRQPPSRPQISALNWRPAARGARM